jgi:hypothetical protein
MATFFALVTIPKDQLKGTTHKTANNVMDKPRWETELAVTQAIITGECNGFDSFDAYDAAKRWQKHLKASQPHFFSRKTAKPTPNGKYMHTMFQR